MKHSSKPVLPYGRDEIVSSMSYEIHYLEYSGVHDKEAEHIVGSLSIHD